MRRLHLCPEYVGKHLGKAVYDFFGFHVKIRFFFLMTNTKIKMVQICIYIHICLCVCIYMFFEHIMPSLTGFHKCLPALLK